MSIETAISEIKTQAEKSSPLGGTLKFVLDGSPIFIDGTGEQNQVSTEDNDAQCTITTTVEILNKLKGGELNPMMAVMGGKVKIKGDMSLAMKLQSLLGG